jgi:hypothetical protein
MKRTSSHWPGYDPDAERKQGPIDLDITIHLDAGTVTIQGRGLTGESLEEVVAIIGRARLAGALAANP